jgi:signal transduction histidine kinase
MAVPAEEGVPKHREIGATMEKLSVSDREVIERKRYLEITSADEDQLRAVHGIVKARAPEIIDRFYEYLLGHEHTRAILEAPGLIERLKALQTRYFLELTSGDYGPAYFESRIRLGQVHHRIGLSPEWYIGAYLKYLQIVSDVLSTAFGRDQERFFQTNVSLMKVIYLDMGLTLDAYHLAAETALREQAEELEAANAKLRELQAAKQLLSDMIVHDLQNPLAGVQGFLQILSQKMEGQSPRVREAMDEALRACNSLSAMILNVLQISRAESGRLEPHFEDLDLATVVAEAARPYESLFPREGRELRVDVPPALPLCTDRHLVQRILQNLLRNALRHTPPGTRVVVRTERRDEDAGVLLSVIDDGPGIPPDLQRCLFEPFGSPKLRAAGVRVDSGLGLAFCRVASEALGAEFRLESDGRSGAAFHLLLPYGVQARVAPTN